ncbi:MAG: flagellar hook-length control protein FliK [Phycisphaerales bacterium]
MTATIQATAASTNQLAGSARSTRSASGVALGSRTFEQVFGEAIDERPEAVKVEEPDHTEPADRGDERDRAEAKDDRDEGEVADPGEGSAEAPNAAAGEVAEPIADTDEYDEDDVVALTPADPDHPDRNATVEDARATPTAAITTEGIRHEITHAADVDLAAMNAGELSTRGRRSELSEAPDPDRAGSAKPDAARARSAAIHAETKGQTSDSSQGEAKSAGGERGATTTPAPNTNSPASTGAPAATAAASAAGSTASTTTTAAPSSTATVSAGTGVGAAAVAGAGAPTGPTGSSGTTTPAAAALERLTSLGNARTQSTESAPKTTPSARHPALAQVQRGLAQVLKEGGGTVNLRLNPRSLGEVKVELTLKEGVATARFEASSESARRLLSDNLTTLRQALEAKGVRVESLSVEVREGERPTESANGQRTGTDAGPGHKGDGTPDGLDARSETGAEGGSRGDARDAHQALSGGAGTRARGDGDAELPEHADITDDLADESGRGALRGAWVGLDMVA